MKSNRLLYGEKIRFRQGTQQAFKAAFISRHDLVSHGFSRLPGDSNQRLAGVLAARIAGERHDHHPRQGNRIKKLTKIN
jgi:hypothetical protein